MDFDKNWKYFIGNLAPKDETDGWGGAKARAYNYGATAFKLDDTKWKAVTLPHDFVIEGDYTRKHMENSDMQAIPEMESIDSRHFAGGSLDGGVCWYRKHFTSEDGWENKRIYLHFGGIYRNSTVYINEYFVGTHKNGYTSFYYDITDFLNLDGENVIAVRVDSTGREGWWYEGGGIYRHVWLEVKEQVHIEPYSLYVSASDIDISKKTAMLRVQVDIQNYFVEQKKIAFQAVIKDAEGKIVCQSGKEAGREIVDKAGKEAGREIVGQAEKETDENAIAAWDKKTFVQSVSLENVTLWDIHNPYLYTVEITIYVDGLAIDSEQASLGIRKIEFNAEKGFFLNDRHVRIQGLCCHHDHAGVGIAIPDEVWEYRLEQMKKMGANAYRSAHHQPSCEVLDICDRMGILVLDETRRMSSAPADLEELRTVIKHGRNHPSVILWGIGNEEIFSQDRPETIRTTITMRQEVRKLDDTRPITSAVVCWNGVERFDTAQKYIAVTKELDVMGFNYCKTAWSDYHESMPKQPIIITEASANSWTRGCYETDESRGQYYIYDKENADKCINAKKAVKKDMAENEWKQFAESPYLSGIFLWTGMDYRGEPTPLSYPAVYSQFGIFDYCGFEKDNFYYYQSWWQNEPVLHIFPHWNYYGQEGKKLIMYGYSNLEEVELLVNGKSYGKKEVEKNWYVSWDEVIYEPGQVAARGYRNGDVVIEKKIETTGNPANIVIEPYQKQVVAGKTALFKISIVDEKGRVVPTADNELYFSVEGAGSFLGCGNGNPGDHASDKMPFRRAFNGLCEVLVHVEHQKDTKVILKVSAVGLKTASYEIKII